MTPELLVAVLVSAVVLGVLLFIIGGVVFDSTTLGVLGILLAVVPLLVTLGIAIAVAWAEALASLAASGADA